MLKSHEKNTIFILDGLDEVLLEEQHEIINILYKKLYGKATIVVFCRTGLFELREEERRQLFGIPMKHDFCDKRNSHIGVTSQDNKRQFLIKFVSETIVDNIIESLSSQLDLFDSPLFLMLIPIILEDDEHIGQFTTKTDLYKKLFNSVVKHNYVKRGLDIDTDFDLFSYHQTTNAVQECISEFGMLSVQKIVKNALRFESDNLTREIYELRFFDQQERNVVL
uniref:NACHT domain-containing protein n=1 Tax=Strigamia maritima TaxID=126957 RepID=T1JG67_STRMM